MLAVQLTHTKELAEPGHAKTLSREGSHLLGKCEEDALEQAARLWQRLRACPMPAAPWSVLAPTGCAASLVPI